MSSNTNNNNENNNNEDEKVVNLITSGAALLSGDLDECLTPFDESCEGGIASVTAYARNLINDNEPYVIVQDFDKDSPFVNMHPLQWVVNRVVMHDIFNLNVFISSPSILYQNKGDPNSVSKRDISSLQTLDMPLLISNSAIPPSYSWHEYTEAVHLDSNTKLAIASIGDEGVPLWVGQVDASKGILDYITKLNINNGCYKSIQTDYEEYMEENVLFTEMKSMLFNNSTSFSDNNNNNNNILNNDNSNNNKEPICWISVILYHDNVEANYYKFLDAITIYENPPDLIINMEDAYETFPIPQLYKETNVFVGSCPSDSDTYCQHRIILSQDEQSISNVTFIKEDLENLPIEYKDDDWIIQTSLLRILAEDAQSNNPVIGYSGFMPITRSGQYRACKAGECPLGNLFTDAIRWFTKTDVAFTSSGGYRGEGWSAGEVRLTDLYAGLPFPNTECVGTMSGVSLFQLLNYTTSIATFEGEDTNDGGRLLQVSGMKVTFNTLLKGSRLISVDIWNNELQKYQPLDRLKLYTFSTDSYVCGAYDPYPDFTGGNFVIDGEIPGQIGDELIQNLVASYLSDLSIPYDTSIQGRLKNATQIFKVLNLVQNEDTCPPNTIWSEESLTCFPCPSYEHVLFSDEVLNFEADSERNNLSDEEENDNDINSDNDNDDNDNDDDLLAGRIILRNRESFGVSVLLKSSPRWIQFTKGTLVFGTVTNIDRKNSIYLESGESLVLEFDVNAASLGGGTDRVAFGTVSFGVEDGGSYPRCSGQDATFDIRLRVTPADEKNQLGTIRYAGIALMAIVFVTTVLFISWVIYNRKTRIIKVMQPLFLLSVCFGILILSASIIPMSIDDAIADNRGCEIACMAIPWLVSTGFTLSFAALFSKLWRINRLFNSTQGFRRIIVSQRDVLAPFAILFGLNLVFLLTWTFVDPLRWIRQVVDDAEDWNTYGSCAGSGIVSKIMLGLLAGVNGAALLLACMQAYLARNISDEFSESKYIGIAIYGWVQILIVGIPILFLIDNDNPSARYFLQVALIFIVSMSMLLIIFVPAFVNFNNYKKQKNTLGGGGSKITISGIEMGGDTKEQDPQKQGEIVMKGLRRPKKGNSGNTRSGSGSSGGSVSSGSTKKVRQAAGPSMGSILEGNESSSSEDEGYDGPSFPFRNNTSIASTNSTLSTNVAYQARSAKRQIEQKMQGGMKNRIDALMLQMQSTTVDDDPEEGGHSNIPSGIDGDGNIDDASSFDDSDSSSDDGNAYLNNRKRPNLSNGGALANKKKDDHIDALMRQMQSTTIDDDDPAAAAPPESAENVGGEGKDDDEGSSSSLKFDSSSSSDDGNAYLNNRKRPNLSNGRFANMHKKNNTPNDDDDSLSS